MHSDVDGPDPELMLRLLAERPRDLDQLRRALGEEGVFTDTDQLRLALQWREDVCEFRDGAWGHVPTLADDVVLTHRLTEAEVRLGVLSADRGLALWAQLADEGYPFAAGGQLQARWTDRAGPLPERAGTGLAGPGGWLDGHEAGDLIGLRLRQGAIALEEVRKLDPEVPHDVTGLLLAEATSLAEEYLRRYEEEGEPIPGASIDDIVLGVRRRDADAFRTPLPPLADVLEAAGLELWHGYVGLPGAPWYDTPPGLDERGTAVFQAVMGMFETHRRSGAVPGVEVLATVVAALDADTLEVIGTELSLDPDREPVAQAMADALPGSAVAPYLRSRAAEGRGDPMEQMALLEAVVEADPHLTCALDDLAELYSVRGDAHAAHRLYQRSEAEPTLPGFAVLRRFLPAAEGVVGRNRPCPCGSGRKYKVCHGRKVPHPFPMRADWLWTKVVAFAMRARQRDVVMKYATILVGPDADVREIVVTALTDGLAHDLALFDDGLLAQFLDERGELLPEDERALTEQWLDSDRRLLEVLESRPSNGLRCRDLVTGEEIEIRDRTMPAQLEPLDLIYGRPLADGAGALRVRDAPRLVPRLARSRLLPLLREGAPGEQIAWFFAPSHGLPELRTSEGEEVLMCTARYDVLDPDSLWAGLRSQGLEPTGEDVLTEMTEVPGRGNVVRGTITRHDAGRIAVETNAVERLRRLQAWVLEVEPQARLVDESTVSPARMLAEHEQAGGTPAVAGETPDSELSPEMEQEAVAELVRRHEETWPDTEIPALGGRTPRQAMADPDLRPELEALLDDFEWTQRRQLGGTMDLDRIRRDLGLDPR